MPGLKTFKKISLESVDVSKFQDNVENVLKPVLNAQFLNGRLIKNINLTSGSTNIIEHKLERELIGWIITRKTANSNIWDEQSLNTFKSKNLLLQCSNNVIIDIWVF